MKFDILAMDFKGLENKQQNVFYENELFKTRVINLEAGGMIPECEMKDFVIFNVVQGEVKIYKNGEAFQLKVGQSFITEPATVSMKTEKGARLMGIQIVNRK